MKNSIANISFMQILSFFLPNQNRLLTKMETFQFCNMLNIFMINLKIFDTVTEAFLSENRERDTQIHCKLPEPRKTNNMNEYYVM